MLLILSKAVESVNFFAIVRVAQSVQFQMLLNLLCHCCWAEKYLSFCLCVMPTLRWRMDGDERAKDFT
jgi:hypothetical protein